MIHRSKDEGRQKYGYSGEKLSETSVTEVSHKDLVIPASDGFSLAATRYDARPDRSQGRAIAIHAALGAPRQYYRHFACWLAEQGFDVVTYDVRGNGQS